MKGPQASLADTPRIIGVAGGYWTGASAAFDLVTEHESCAMVPYEFALLSYGQLIGEATARSGGHDVSEAVATGLFRLRQFNRPERFYPVRPVLRRLAALAGFHPVHLTAIRAGMGARLGPAYEDACERFARAFERGGAADVANEFRRLLDAIARSVAEGRAEHTGVVVLDQFIGPAFAEAALELDSRLRFVFVDRDWRDQYTELREILPGMMAANARLGTRPSGEEPGDYRATPQEFFVRVRRRIDGCRRRHESARVGQILWVDFEDLVQDTAATAARVFEFLGLALSGWRPNTKLVPEKSQKNVGKWRQFPFPRELESLAEKLPTPR